MLDVNAPKDQSRLEAGLVNGRGAEGTGMKRSTHFVARMIGGSLLVLAATGAAAQSAPTLDKTFGFVRDRIAEQGLINFASTTHDPAGGQTWDNLFTAEASAVVRDTAACTVDFHWHTSVDGKTAQDLGSTIQFKMVSSVAVTSLDDDIARLNADGGHAAWVTKMRPTIWVLLARKSNGHTNTVDFRDRDMAERVAKAMRHAAQLCGGSKSQPF